MSEDSLQIAVANYLRLQYPNALFTHIANERQTSPQRGAKFKKMGVKRGMPDIVVFDTRGRYNGLAIELKIKPNKPTSEQIKVMEHLSKLNWCTSFCYDFKEAQNVIDKYFNDY